MHIDTVPAYLNNDFSHASPGLRFGMYLKLKDINNKVSALDKAKQITPQDKSTMTAIAARQTVLAHTVPEAWLLHLAAQSTAPFTTGLGNEHPLENGFAFLNPYGLPYLPGSGIKGVLRQAARELASGEWGETQGWSDAFLPSPASGRGAGGEGLTVIDILFGKESNDGDTEHLRGVLTFWDVIPQIAGDSLAVEIMTPHQSHYYQQNKAAGSTTPHDSGQPTPISFLTVPPKSDFAFYVQCDLVRLQHIAPELAENGKWKTLLTAAFEHAFEWLGFGAKTAVGYGAMVSEAQRQKQEEEKRRRKEAKDAAANAEYWKDAHIKFWRDNGSLTVKKRNGKSATAFAPRGKELLDSLPAELRRKIETNQFVKIKARVAEGELREIEP